MFKVKSEKPDKSEDPDNSDDHQETEALHSVILLLLTHVTVHLLLSFIWNVGDYDEGCDCGRKGEDDHDKINNIVPGLLAEEHWKQNNDHKDLFLGQK